MPSRCQMRWTTSSSSARRKRPATDCSSAAGRSASIVSGRPVTIASRLRSIPSSSLFIGTTNASIPSRSSLSVTSSRSMPASLQRVQVLRGVERRGLAVHLALAGGGGEGRQGHRVDGVAADEAVDVHRLGVGRVLDPGRGPQRPLHRAPGLAQGGEALAVEHVAEGEIGGAGVGEPGAAGEVVAPCRLEPLVDLGVDARDEERGDEWRSSGRPAVAPALRWRG